MIFTFSASYYYFLSLTLCHCHAVIIDIDFLRHYHIVITTLLTPLLHLISAITSSITPLTFFADIIIYFRLFFCACAAAAEQPSTRNAPFARAMLPFLRAISSPLRRFH
jgi:hypothetical protein